LNRTDRVSPPDVRSPRPAIDCVIVEKNIHVVANAEAKVVTGATHRVQSSEQFESVARRQRADDLQRLLEHPYQSVEVSFVLQADIVTETRRPFAVKHHQIGETRRLSDRLLIVRDRLLGFGDRRGLILEHIRPQAAVDGGFVRLAHRR